MPELFRCRICGEVYFGKHPSHCPFCGAHEKFLIKMNVWKEENIGVEVGEKSLANLRAAQKLEYDNTRFYKACAQSKNPEIAGYFKYLSKIEAEHYSVFCKLAGDQKDPTIMDPSEDKGSDLANLEYGSEREAMAKDLYAKFAEEATETRVKEVFTEIGLVETDHLNLDHEEIDKIEG